MAVAVIAGQMEREMQIKIGNIVRNVANFSDASRVWREYRNAAAFGASSAPKVIVIEDGKEVAEISYNGRVWPVGHLSLHPFFTRDNKPLFDPYI